MSGSDSPERSFVEEQPTQSLSWDEVSPKSNEHGAELVEQKSYLELHTPQILTSMETVPDEQDENAPETMCEIFSQSVVPFFLGGCGSISAGLLLTYANKEMKLLEEVPEFLVLMPPLQGLRGNLDMTFSARMSTLAHKGAFEKPGIVRKVWRNAAVAQALSVFVCIIANLISLLIVHVSPELSEVDATNTTFGTNSTSSLQHSDQTSFLFLTSSSIISMAGNCGLCTLLLFTIVYCTWKRNYNPDNIVAPLGASVSDLLTIGSMLLVCYMLRPYSEFNNIVPIVIIVLAVWSVPVWIYLSWKDDTAVKTARQQCLTLVFASMVSCGAGYLQSRGAMQFPNYPAYQTLISGLAGNRGAVLASRISSHLEVQKKSELEFKERVWPLTYYKSKTAEARTAKLLLCTALPFQMFFVGVSTLASFLMKEPVESDYKFFIAYSLVVLIQQSVIIYLAQLLVYSLWSFGIDPDIHAIPLLTSSADVCGCGLLYLLFLALNGIFGCVETKST